MEGKSLILVYIDLLLPPTWRVLQFWSCHYLKGILVSFELSFLSLPLLSTSPGLVCLPVSVSPLERVEARDSFGLASRESGGP